MDICSEWLCMLYECVHVYLQYVQHADILCLFVWCIELCGPEEGSWSRLFPVCVMDLHWGVMDICKHISPRMEGRLAPIIFCCSPVVRCSLLPVLCGGRSKPDVDGCAQTGLLQDRTGSEAPEAGWTSWAGAGHASSAGPFLMMDSMMMWDAHFRSCETVNSKNLKVSRLLWLHQRAIHSRDDLSSYLTFCKTCQTTSSTSLNQPNFFLVIRTDMPDSVFHCVTGVCRYTEKPWKKSWLHC